MGFEFEFAPRPAAATQLPQVVWAALEDRWQEAQRRLAAAQAQGAALRAWLPPDHPASIGAELELAEARRRCWQVAAVLSEVDDP